MEQRYVLKLSIQNFEAIQQALITFYPGITVITGPNASGKTSILRALGVMLRNDSKAKHRIKHGEDQLVVGLKTPESEKIVFQCSKSSREFIIGASEYSTPGQGSKTLLELYPELPFTIDDKKLLCLLREGEALFPFGRSASAMYKLFERFMAVSDSESVFRRFRADKTELKKQEELTLYKIDLLTTKIDYLEQYLAYLEQQTFDQRALQLELAASQCQTLQEEYQKAERLSSVTDLVSWGYRIFPVSFPLMLQQDFQFAQSAYVFLALSSFSIRVFPLVSQPVQDAVVQGQQYEAVLSDLDFSLQSFECVDVYSKDFQFLCELQQELTHLLSQEQDLQQRLKCLTEKFQSVEVCPMCQRPL